MEKRGQFHHARARPIPRKPLSEDGVHLPDGVGEEEFRSSHEIFEGFQGEQAVGPDVQMMMAVLFEPPHRLAFGQEELHHSVFIEHSENPRRPWGLQDQGELIPHPLHRHVPEAAASLSHQGPGAGLKIQWVGCQEAVSAENPERIVSKRERCAGAKLAGAKIGETAERVDEFDSPVVPPGQQVNGHGIDGEIPVPEVFQD